MSAAISDHAAYIDRVFTDQTTVIDQLRLSATDILSVLPELYRRMGEDSASVDASTVTVGSVTAASGNTGNGVVLLTKTLDGYNPPWQDGPVIRGYAGVASELAVTSETMTFTCNRDNGRDGVAEASESFDWVGGPVDPGGVWGYRTEGSGQGPGLTAGGRQRWHPSAPRQRPPRRHRSMLYAALPELRREGADPVTAAAPHTAADDTFLAAVLARPDDALPKLIYGDFLEEQDRCDEAEFWRWLAAAGTWPERSRHVEEYWCWNRAGGYWAEPQHETPPESVVPQKLFWEVPDRITDCSEHRSARDALLALLDAWLRLPAGQRPKA